MKIQIQHLPSQGMELAYKKSARDFPVLKQLTDEGECRFADPIVIELAIVPERNLIKASGFIDATVKLACSRCLEGFHTPLHRRFTLRFSRDIPKALHKDEAEAVALTAEEIGLVYFKGDEIDFSAPIQEQLVLSLPFKPLCAEDCKGLCPRCGTNLNTETCECAGRTAASSFSVLKELDWPNL